MKKQLHCVLVLFLLVVLAGCGTPGFPRQSYNPKKQIKQLEKKFNMEDLINKYYATNATNATNATETVTETDKRDARDKMIDGRLVLINLNYNQFIAQFSVTKESLDFVTEVTELGLNLATTAVGGAGTKTVLAAISAGVTGTKLAVDKNFFYEKTVPVLVTTMNAQRQVALAPLLIGMKNTTVAYPLARALSDLDAYYLAGTFIGALQAIQATEGAKGEAAEAKITFIRNEGWTAEATQLRVDAILDKIEKLSRPAAIALENNLPFPANGGVKVQIKMQDKRDLRLKNTDADNPNGTITRVLLKMRVTMSDRSEAELAAWEAALKP